MARAGLAAFAASVAAVRYFRPFENNFVWSATAIIMASTAAIFLVDLGWQNVHLRQSTGLDFTRDDPSWSRTLIKFVGLIASLGIIGLGYWLFADYYEGAFFDNARALLRLVLAPWLVCSRFRISTGSTAGCASRATATGTWASSSCFDGARWTGAASGSISWASSSRASSSR